MCDGLNRVSTPDGPISCHDRRPPKKVINGRYDLQIVASLVPRLLTLTPTDHQKVKVKSTEDLRLNYTEKAGPFLAGAL